LFRVNASAVSPLLKCALPHLTNGKAMADRLQLTTGARAGFSAVAGKPGAADAERDLRGFALKFETR
jgi:catalase